MISTYGIEENAFNAEAFKSVKTLSFVRMHLTELKKGIFNGLESLEVLNIGDVAFLQSVDIGILYVLNQTLKEFTFERLEGAIHQENTSVEVEAFAGSEQPLNVEFINIRYFIYRLTRESLVGLKNVKYLDLSHCGIAIIEDGAFDPIERV